MAHAIPCGGVEKQHLIRFGDGLISSEMADENTAIREHEMGRGGALFVALMRVATLAGHIADLDGVRLEETLRSDFRHALDAPVAWPIIDQHLIDTQSEDL